MANSHKRKMYEASYQGDSLKGVESSSLFGFLRHFNLIDSYITNGWAFDVARWPAFEHRWNANSFQNFPGFLRVNVWRYGLCNFSAVPPRRKKKKRNDEKWISLKPLTHLTRDPGTVCAYWRCSTPRCAEHLATRYIVSTKSRKVFSFWQYNISRCICVF